MGSDTLCGLFRAFFQFTSEIVCIPDVSANLVIVLLYVGIFRLGHRIMS